MKKGKLRHDLYYVDDSIPRGQVMSKGQLDGYIRVWRPKDTPCEQDEYGDWLVEGEYNVSPEHVKEEQ